MRKGKMKLKELVKCLNYTISEMGIMDGTEPKEMPFFTIEFKQHEVVEIH